MRMKSAVQATKPSVLQNPFHPLDLSANDLLQIYKKFDVSRTVNRNPKQELPIETIAQLISSLKGCKASYVQKCMSQALIKDTISWNQFLSFLDQESEVRANMFDWLIHQKSVVKWKYHSTLHLTPKIGFQFQTVSSIDYPPLGDDKLALFTIDGKTLVLFNITDGQMKKIDQFQHKNTTDIRKDIFTLNNQGMKNNSLPLRNRMNKSTLNKKGTQTKDYRPTNTLINRSIILRSDGGVFGHHGLRISKNLEQEEQYLNREKKNIHAIFSLFTELPLEQSRKFADIANEKIQNRTLNIGHVNHLRDTFEGFISEAKIEYSTEKPKQQKPILRAKSIVQTLRQEKNALSYNPYKSYRAKGMESVREASFFGSSQKKIMYQRKQKHYSMESCHSKYNAELGCMLIVYFNLEMSLVRAIKEYHKIKLEQQSTARIFLDKDYKKNDVIQMVDFYHHSTTDKWFVLLLFRMEFKQDPNSNNESFVRGYEIIKQQGKRKGEKKFVFANEKQLFTIELGKCEIVKMVAQHQFGLHFIAHNGRYIIYKEDYYPLTKDKDSQMSYWRKQFEERFKGATLSLSCLNVSTQMNKAIIGTVKGNIIIYDLFSKQYKMHKICQSSIVQIQILDEQCFILCQNQKLIIFHISRAEQIQCLNVKNEERLHEKIGKFVFHEQKIICFGSSVRIFQRFIDDDLQQRKFKMQNIYTWRLNKVNKSTIQETKQKIKMIPSFRKTKTYAQLFVCSQNFLVVLTQIHEAIFYSSENLQVKFTTILQIPHDEKIQKVSISQDQKLIAVLLASQQIHVFNIFTQYEVLNRKPTSSHKYTSISFLDKANQYLLAAGTESGQILLLPFTPTQDRDQKVLDFHQSSVTVLHVCKNSPTSTVLISCGENLEMAIWQLPFNVLKNQIRLKNLGSAENHISQSLGSCMDQAFFRTQSGQVVTLNMSKLEIKVYNNEELNNYTSIAFSQLGYAIGGGNNICIWDKQTDEWTRLMTINIPSNNQKRIDSKQQWWVTPSNKNKNQIIGIGIIEKGSKAVIFTKNGLYTWTHKNERLSRFKSFLQSIQ